MRTRPFFLRGDHGAGGHNDVACNIAVHGSNAAGDAMACRGAMLSPQTEPLPGRFQKKKNSWTELTWNHAKTAAMLRGDHNAGGCKDVACNHGLRGRSDVAGQHVVAEPLRGRSRRNRSFVSLKRACGTQ